MTRVGIMSDLHIECEPPEQVTVDYVNLARAREAIPGHPAVGPVLEGLRGSRPDIVLLAGDLDEGGRATVYADAVARFVGAPVVQVAGNHEFWRHDIDLVIDRCRTIAAGTNGRVTFLENERAHVAGLMVAGCTLWTDYNLHGERAGAMHAAARGMSDHALITRAGVPFTPAEALERHKDSLNFLRGSRADVLLTHHAPLPEANPPRYARGSLAPAFASDLASDIRAIRPRLWVFGHTHHDVDILVGATWVLSAQRGYVGDEFGAEAFVPRVVDL